MNERGPKRAFCNCGAEVTRLEVRWNPEGSLADRALAPVVLIVEAECGCVGAQITVEDA